MRSAEAIQRTAWEEMPIECIFAPLEDGRTLHQGWSPQCHKVPSVSEDAWGVLKTTSIQAGEFQPEHNKLLPTGLDPRPLIEVKEGDILITCAGPRARCGVSCLVRQTRKRLMMSGKMYRFRVDAARADARYVEAFLQTERARLAIDKMKTGSSDSGLNLTHDRFRQLSIPVGPLPEQRRIVAEIEKQFTRLEAGLTALKRVQAGLKRYRAAVLKAACEGKLVPTEAELAKVAAASRRSASGSGVAPLSPDKSRDGSSTFETGAQLLARILAERRAKWTGRGSYKEPAVPDAPAETELPEGWVWAGFDQLSDGSRHAMKAGPFGSSLKKSVYTPRGFKIYGQEQVIKGDAYYGDYFISRDLYEKLRSCEVHAGDILVSLVGTAGKVLVLPADCAPGIINPRLLKMSLSRSGIHPKFIKILMEAPQTRTFFKLAAHGGTMEILNLGILKSLPVPLPPLAEQTRIVAEVERRLSVVEELEAVVSANLQRAGRLRQSILKNAMALS